VPPVQTDQQTSTAQGPPVPSSDKTTIAQPTESSQGRRTLTPEETRQRSLERLRSLEQRLAEEKKRTPNRYSVTESVLESRIGELNLHLYGRSTDFTINGVTYKPGDTLPPEAQKIYNDGRQQLRNNSQQGQ
jgi:hypothetical protein